MIVCKGAPYNTLFGPLRGGAGVDSAVLSCYFCWSFWGCLGSNLLGKLTNACLNLRVLMPQMLIHVRSSSRNLEIACKSPGAKVRLKSFSDKGVASLPDPGTFGNVFWLEID